MFCYYAGTLCLMYSDLWDISEWMMDAGYDIKLSPLGLSDDTQPTLAMCKCRYISEGLGWIMYLSRVSGFINDLYKDCFSVLRTSFGLISTVFYFRIKSSPPAFTTDICSHSWMSSTHLLLGLPRFLLPSILPSNIVLSKVLCLFMWPK